MPIENPMLTPVCGRNNWNASFAKPFVSGRILRIAFGDRNICFYRFSVVSPAMFQSSRENLSLWFQSTKTKRQWPNSEPDYQIKRTMLPNCNLWFLLLDSNWICSKIDGEVVAGYKACIATALFPPLSKDIPWILSSKDSSRLCSTFVQPKSRLKLALWIKHFDLLFGAEIASKTMKFGNLLPNFIKLILIVNDLAALSLVSFKPSDLQFTTIYIVRLSYSFDSYQEPTGLFCLIA